MGTVLGDPIEAQALIAAYGRDRAAGRPLWIGSMKSNLGHTQAVGRRGRSNQDRHGDAARPAAEDAARRRPLASDRLVERRGVAAGRARAVGSRTASPRRAAVHSFGMSGTNVHIILEEAPPLEVPLPTPRAAGAAAGARRRARAVADLGPRRGGAATAGAAPGAVPRRAARARHRRHRPLAGGAPRAESSRRPCRRRSHGAASAREALAEGPPAAELGEDRPATGLAEGRSSADGSDGVVELGSREDLALLAQAWIAGARSRGSRCSRSSMHDRCGCPRTRSMRRRHWVEHSPMWAADGPIVLVGRKIEPTLCRPGAAAIASACR